MGVHCHSDIDLQKQLWLDEIKTFESRAPTANVSIAAMLWSFDNLHFKSKELIEVSKVAWPQEHFFALSREAEMINF